MKSFNNNVNNFQTLAKHIMNVHMNSNILTDEPKEGELSLELLKKYINYCRT